ncbi:MAG: type I glyceraldehyde-3-phosphate dehydrogenase [Deltaproteobacteria bacterium]|nr:type I glyceraldehyde-3-phosphate dehydrogenase [Deltaproteobacteria bacterium]
MPIRIAINGFGRIGRNAFRAAFRRRGLFVAAVNDLTDPKTLAHLLQYDSVMGRFEKKVEPRDEALAIDGEEIRVFRAEEPGTLPWGELGIDVVLECTGRFTRRDQAACHLDAGARRVIVSAPSAGADVTVVLGVNHQLFDPARHRVVSNASCTTNCLAPVVKVLHERFGVAKGLMTTVHSYTNDQRLLDLPHRDLRRARAAALSMIPTSTGAARAVGLVLPELAGRLDGVSVRVPTPDVSLADFTASLERPATVEEVNRALREAAEGPLQGILGYTEEPLVSADYVRCPLSAVVDGPQTCMVGDNLVKVLAWYDNEWGYSNRLVELAELVGVR